MSTRTSNRPARALAAALGVVRAYAERRQVVWLPGSIPPEAARALVVDFDPSRSAEPPHAPQDGAAAAGVFVAALERLNVALLVADVGRLAADEVDVAVVAYEDALARLADRAAARDAAGDVDGRADATDADVEAALEGHLAAARAARRHVGEVAWLDLCAVTRGPTLVVRWLELAPWAEVVHAADRLVREATGARRGGDGRDGAWGPRPEVLTQRAEYEAREREWRLWTGPKGQEAARRLAAHEDFAQCTREAERVVLLRELLGDDAPADAQLLKEIAREAHAVAEVGRRSAARARR